MNNSRRIAAAPALSLQERIPPAGWLVALGGGAALWLLLLATLRRPPHQ